MGVIKTEILHPLGYLWEGLPPIVRATVHRHRIHQPHPRNPFLFPAQNLVRELRELQITSCVSQQFLQSNNLLGTFWTSVK